MILSEDVIREAFQRVLGRLAPTTLQECIDEFSGTYPVLGTEQAFNRALGAKAPAVDPSTHDSLFLRFESALALEQAEQKKKSDEEKEKRAERRREAKTKEEKQAAKDEEDALRAEVSAKMADLKAVQNSLRQTHRGILTAAREIRKDARDSGHGKAEAVIAALEEVEDIVGRDGEVNSLVTNAGEIAKEAQEAARDRQVAVIEASTMAIEASRDRLDDLLAIDLAEARDKVDAAITAVEDEKTEGEKATAIKKAVDDSAAAITAAEDAAKKVRDGVHQYKRDYLDFHGEDLEVDDADPDSVDKLVERAEQALADAREANDQVISASEADDRDAAETEAANVAAEREKVQDELKKLDQKAEALKQEKDLSDTRKGVTGRREKEDKEKKTGQLNRLLASWQGHATLFGLFLLGIVLSLLFTPWWVQIGVILSALVVLAGYGFSFLRGKPERGVVALGGHFLLILLFLLFLALAPLIGKGPGSDRSLIPSDPTTTPTSSAQQAGDYPTQAELDAEATASAATPAAEAANNP